MRNTPLREAVYDFIVRDRQWPRAHRIAHARLQLSRAQSSKAQDVWDTPQFWRAVLKANGAR
jgi:hypothetical protein